MEASISVTLDEASIKISNYTQEWALKYLSTLLGGLRIHWQYPQQMDIDWLVWVL